MDKLNMSLDEIAAQRRKQNRGRGRGRGLRPGFRGRNRGRPVQNRQRPVRKGNTRLRISNLNKAITNEELKKIFAEYGKLTRCGVHFNKMGESQGTGDIEYETHEEAEKALQKLNSKYIKINLNRCGCRRRSDESCLCCEKESTKCSIERKKK